jgi:phage baseplate assembly protein W
MKGYAPKLPLTLDPTDGYRLTKTTKETAQQNLKMLVLTSPGERIWDPAFGVGLYNFLFELDTVFVQEDIRARINSQVQKYLPFITILGINFGEQTFDTTDRNTLAVTIKYSIPVIGTVDTLRVRASR